MQFWVYGRFEVADDRITVWRDSFDWLNITLALLRGLAGAVIPALAAKPPSKRLPTAAAHATPIAMPAATSLG